MEQNISAQPEVILQNDDPELTVIQEEELKSEVDPKAKMIEERLNRLDHEKKQNMNSNHPSDFNINPKTSAESQRWGEVKAKWLKIFGEIQDQIHIED